VKLRGNVLLHNQSFFQFIFWQSPVKVNSQLDLVVPPQEVSQFDELVAKIELKTLMTTGNLQEQIDIESTPVGRTDAGEDMNWTEYHDTQTIYDWLDLLVAEFPNFLTVIEFGQTYDGRPLKLVKLSKKTVSCRNIYGLTSDNTNGFIDRAIAHSSLKQMFTLASGLHPPLRLGF